MHRAGTGMRLLACMAGASALLALSGGVGAQPETSAAFSALVKERHAIAAGLAAPAAECFQRTDTRHPVFKGCIDWHSASHAAWALLAYTRLTGDSRYVSVVRSAFTEEGLRQELAYLKAHPSFEMPYGRAWFLRLATEYQRVIGDGALAMLADHIKVSLLEHYRRHPPLPDSRSYDSASWALMNLFDHAEASGDAPTRSEVRDMVASRFMAPGGRCLAENETGHFMAVCVNWAWLVAKTQPRSRFLDWYASWQPDLRTLSPVTSPRNAHAYGLNFSRAWGLAPLASLTGHPALLKSYADHFNVAYRTPSNWRGDYLKVGHWVAQFGMLAAFPLFEAP